VTAVEVVRTRVLALSAVTSLVGTRVSSVVLPQNETLPAMRVHRVSETESMHLRGVSGLQVARVQVDSYAASLAAALAIDAAARGDGAGSGLSGFIGTVGEAAVHGIFPMGVQDMYEKDGQDAFYRVSRDYEVHYTG
jgi:hypothetical protein